MADTSTTWSPCSLAPRTAVGALPAAAVAALTGMLGVAAVCWVVAVREMKGVDMGVGTGLGSFGFFVAVWVVMMPSGVAPAVVRHARSPRVRVVPLFVVSYLVVWALLGLAVYAAHRPHGTSAAAAAVIAAGIRDSRRSNGTSASAAAGASAQESCSASIASARAAD